MGKRWKKNVGEEKGLYKRNKLFQVWSVKCRRLGRLTSDLWGNFSSCPSHAVLTMRLQRVTCQWLFFIWGIVSWRHHNFGGGVVLRNLFNPHNYLDNFKLYSLIYGQKPKSLYPSGPVLALPPACSNSQIPARSGHVLDPSTSWQVTPSNSQSLLLPGAAPKAPQAHLWLARAERQTGSSLSIHTGKKDAPLWAVLLGLSRERERVSVRD